MHANPMDSRRRARKGSEIRLSATQFAKFKAALEDKKRLDWLVSQEVEVRTPLVFGSLALFYARRVNRKNEPCRTSLREQVDQAMASELVGGSIAAPHLRAKRATKRRLLRSSLMGDGPAAESNFIEYLQAVPQGDHGEFPRDRSLPRKVAL